MPQTSEEEDEGEGSLFLTGCQLEFALSSFPCGSYRGYLVNMAAGFPQREQDRESKRMREREKVYSRQKSAFCSLSLEMDFLYLCCINSSGVSH